MVLKYKISIIVLFIILIIAVSSTMSIFISDHVYVLGMKQDIECTDNFECAGCYDFLNGNESGKDKRKIYPGGSFCRGIPFDGLQSLFINGFVASISSIFIVYSRHKTIKH